MLDGLYGDFQAVFAARILMALVDLILLLGKYVRWLLQHVARAAHSSLLVVVDGLVPGVVGLVLNAAVHRIGRQV